MAMNPISLSAPVPRTAIPVTPPPSTMDANYSVAKFAQAILHSKNKNVLWIHNHNKMKPTHNRTQYWKITNIGAPKRKPLSLKLPTNSNAIKPYLHLADSMTPLSEDTTMDHDTEYLSSSSFGLTAETPKTPINCKLKLNIPNAHNTCYDSSDIDYNQTDTDEYESDDGYSTNSYVYPWSAHTSSDDSFADLSESKVYAKIKEKFSTEAEANLKIVAKMMEDGGNKNEDSDIYANADLNAPAFKNWVDPDTGRYLSFIIRDNSSVDDESEYEYEYEYESESEYEYEADIEELEDIPITPPIVTPIQSVCNSFEVQLSGCSITDIE